MPFAVVRPSQRQDIPLAASGQQKKADGGDLEGPFPGVRPQHRRQAAELVVRQEPLAPLPAVAPDAPVRIRPLRAKTHRLGLRTAARLKPALYAHYADLERRIGHTLSPSGVPLPELTGITSGRRRA